MAIYGQQRQSMTEIQLTQADRERIKTEINVTLIFGLILSVALIVLVLLIPLILYFFGKASDGFGRRSLFIVGLLSLPFVAISWPNILKYIDLKIGKKINLKTHDFEIEKTKDGFILKTKSPLKLKLDLWDEIPPLIKNTEPITLELTRLSKTLLFISQDSVNLLEKIETEIDK